MSDSSELIFQIASDTSLLIHWKSEGISSENSHQVLQLFHFFQSRQDSLQILNLHPAYSSLLLEFEILNSEKVQEIERLAQSQNFSESADFGRPIEIPVAYGGESGPDLADVARLTGLTEQQVVEFHSGAEYRVAFLGFTPGFPYLLGLPEKLQCPRKQSPRLRVPRGSVALAGLQTGVYPQESPGGWNLIGRTDLALFTPNENPPVALQPGDRIRFRPVSENSLKNQIAQNRQPLPESPIQILDPGFHSTFQGPGHLRKAHWGIPRGGAADNLALRIGNRLVGNPESAPALEMTLVGATVTFTQDTWIALTGSDSQAALDGIPIRAWTSIPVSAGQRLKVGPLKTGLRSYLCVHDPVRALQSPAFRRCPKDFLEEISRDSTRIRVTTGPQSHWFLESSRQEFFQSAFRVSPDVSRTGLRLESVCPGLNPIYQGREMISEGTALGAIQIASGGQPMLLFCEQGTTGGYPKIANVISADLWKIGQLKPGTEIRFVPVSFGEAWQIRQDFEKKISQAVEVF